MPRIVRADTNAVVTVQPWQGESGSHIVVTAVETGVRTIVEPGNAACRMQPDGVCELSHLFVGEQEHVVAVEVVEDGKRRVAARCSVYSLREDLYAMTPLKGDFHMHSTESDGQEPAARVAAHCRRIGLDFMALTDHRRHQPSLDAAAAFAGVSADLRMFPGEEVHPPGSTVHIVNFGGKVGMTPHFADENAFRAEMARVAASLGPLPDGVDAHMYASSVWCFDKIRAAGGLAVFCHPYWIYRERFDAPEPVTTHLFKTRPFDALELIGGYHVREAEANTLQVARWRDESVRGGEIPVVGASDAHGCLNGELFGWYFTIVWSPSDSLADIVASVKAFRSVAVEARPGEAPRAYGSFRMVKLAYFLLREVFPAHDALCREEGALMQAHLDGDKAAPTRLAACSGQARAYIDACMGRRAL